MLISDAVSQDFIGNVDLKTKSVHFYVQRNSIFNTPKSIIPFESARLNEGDAFSLSSGIFTAPVNGIYHFQFSAVKGLHDTYLDIILQVNGANIALAYTHQPYSPGNIVVSLSASLRLAAGDKVNLFNLNNGGLHDSTVPRICNHGKVKPTIYRFLQVNGTKIALEYTHQSSSGFLASE